MEVRTDHEPFERQYVTAPEWEAEFEVYGEHPVQAFGTVRGRDLYFHAKHGEWSIDVADSNGNLPSDGYFDSDGYYQTGKIQHSGYMPLTEAVAVITTCLREYVASFSPLSGSSAVK